MADILATNIGEYAKLYSSEEVKTYLLGVFKEMVKNRVNVVREHAAKGLDGFL